MCARYGFPEARCVAFSSMHASRIVTLPNDKVSLRSRDAGLQGGGIPMR